MTNSKLILIRHGVTVDNKAGRLMGRNDSPLTSDAIEEARKLSKKPDLKHYLEEDGQLWTSPLPRAHRTAELIASDSTINIRLAGALIERDFGIYNGSLLNDLWNSNDDEWRSAEGDYSVRPQDGESLADVEARVFPFLVNLNETEPTNQHLVLVGHSTVWRLVAAALNQRRKFPLEEKIAGPLSIQEYERNAISLLLPLIPELEGTAKGA